MDENFLSNYLKRIDCEQVKEPTKENLFLLQWNHLKSIPFENMYYYYSKEITLNKEWLYDKIILQKKGGVCYELNLLYYFLLKELGYNIQLFGATAYNCFSNTSTNELNHITILVDFGEGGKYMTDVAFGVRNCRYPLELKPGVTKQMEHGFFRLVQEGEDTWIVQSMQKRMKTLNNEEFPNFYGYKQGDWKNEFRFIAKPITLEDMHKYCQHYTDGETAIFRKIFVFTKYTPNGKLRWYGENFTVHTFDNEGLEETVQSFTVKDDGERKQLLEKYYDYILE